MSKSILSLFLLVSLPAFASYEVTGNALFAKNDAKGSQLSRDANGFFVHQDGETHFIPRHEVDAKLRDKSPEELRAFLASNYVILQKFGHAYKVDTQGRLQGGGPILGAITGCTCFVVGGVSLAGMFAVGAATANPGLMAAAGALVGPMIAGSLKATAIATASPTA